MQTLPFHQNLFNADYDDGGGDGDGGGGGDVDDGDNYNDCAEWAHRLVDWAHRQATILLTSSLQNLYYADDDDESTILSTYSLPQFSNIWSHSLSLYLEFPHYSNT